MLVSVCVREKEHGGTGGMLGGYFLHLPPGIELDLSRHMLSCRGGYCAVSGWSVEVCVEQGEDWEP